MSNVWVLMYNEEVPGCEWGHDGTVTASKPVRVYQQRATAMAKMNQANEESGERNDVGNFHYYSIEEVAYV